MGLKEQLVRATFNGVVFPCLEAGDEEENGVVEHRAYRVTGANLEFTGRGPLKVTLKAAFLNSLIGGDWPADMFPGQYDLLHEEFRSRAEGTLTHPYYGSVDGILTSWKLSYDPGTQQGVFVDVAFTETNASASVPLRFAEAEPGAALSETAADADTAVAALAPTAAPLKPTVDAKLAYLEDTDRDAAQAYGALAEVRTAASTLLELPALAGIDGHEARGLLRAVNALTWKYATRYLTPKPRSRTFQMPAQGSLAKAAAQIYGDPSKAFLLRRANTLPDEMRIPAGFTLKVPDDE